MSHACQNFQKAFGVVVSLWLHSGGNEYPLSIITGSLPIDGVKDSSEQAKSEKNQFKSNNTLLVEATEINIDNNYKKDNIMQNQNKSNIQLKRSKEKDSDKSSDDSISKKKRRDSSGPERFEKNQFKSDNLLSIEAKEINVANIYKKESSRQNTDTSSINLKRLKENESDKSSDDSISKKKKARGRKDITINIRTKYCRRKKIIIKETDKLHLIL
ncbi:zinc finger CCHC domain-containing protein 10-like [Prorops nasuta]|uniref:zinc finger CCHC domain-containing protein 10-like n=1 Tax=Prorops nasuta TaxID=863751 RepID=UPI0034CD6854